jgi:hypothetical protein
MTDPNYKALCAELLDELELWSSWHDATDLKDRAAAALHFDQPEPQPPAAIVEMVNKLHQINNPAIQPEPVSERLPKPGEWVWHCYAGVRFWQHGRYNGRQFFIGDGPESQPATHWLPHWALPMPSPANTINQEDYDRG